MPRLLFALTVTFFYAFFLAIVMFHHELWRDEAQAWMIALGSNSLHDFWVNTRFEGHPLLWFLIIKPFTFFGSPDFIKIPNFLIAASTAFLILRFSPFPRWVAVAAVFSYFFFYEYGVISRNYMLGVFGIIGFLVLRKADEKSAFVPFLFLAIAVAANVYSMILAVGLFVFHAVLFFNHSGNSKLSYRVFGVASLGFILFSFFTLIQLLPPQKSGYAREWFLSFDAKRVDDLFAVFYAAFVPLPADVFAFWNTNILPLEFRASAGRIILFLISALILLRHPRYFILCLFFFVLLMTFQYVKFIGFLRHAGYLWMSFFVVIWILASHRGWQSVFKPLRVFFLMLLLVHCYATLSASMKDLFNPFSGGKTTADFVRQHAPADCKFIAFSDYSNETFTAYHGKPVYYPISRNEGTFIVWSTDRKHWDFDAYLLENKSAFSAADECVWIVSDVLLPQHHDWLTLLFDSGKSISQERHFVYAVLKH